MTTQQIALGEAPSLVVASTGQETIYRFHVTIRYKYGNFTFHNHSRMAQAIRENGGKQLNAFPVFEAYTDEAEAVTDDVTGKAQQRRPTVSINKASTALNNALDEIQSLMMVSDTKRFWYYPGSLDDKIQAFLVKLEEKRVALIQELDSHYDQAKALLRQRLANVLGVAGRGDELETYMKKFPTRFELQDCLAIEVEEPEPINKVLDVASSDPIWARSMQRRQATLQRELPRALTSLLEQSADLIRRMDGEDSRNLGDRKKESLLRAGECTEAAWLTYSGFRPEGYQHEDIGAVIYSQVKAIYDAFTQFRWNEDQIGVSLNNLRELLKQQDCIKSPVSIGEKHLASWVFSDSIDGQLSEAWQEVTNLQTLEDSGALDPEDLAERKRQLRVKIAKLQEAMGIQSKELGKRIARRRQGGGELVARYML